MQFRRRPHQVLPPPLRNLKTLLGGGENYYPRVYYLVDWVPTANHISVAHTFLHKSCSFTAFNFLGNCIRRRTMGLTRCRKSSMNFRSHVPESGLRFRRRIHPRSWRTPSVCGRRPKKTGKFVISRQFCQRAPHFRERYSPHRLLTLVRVTLRLQ